MVYNQSKLTGFILSDEIRYQDTLSRSKFFSIELVKSMKRQEKDKIFNDRVIQQNNRRDGFAADPYSPLQQFIPFVL
jgi:hypothetical protein